MRRRDFLHCSMFGVVAGGLLGPFEFARGSKPAARKRVRVGVFGVQHSHAAGKLTALRQLSDDFEIVGVFEPDAQLQKSLERLPEYQGVPWLPEAKLLFSDDTDSIVIETEAPDLVPTAQRCIDANKHIHLEKPGCESRSAFVHLFRTARERGRHIQMGYMLRYNPAFEFCFRAIREGWLGPIFEVTGSMSKLVNAQDRKKFSDNAGGAMFELGCHLIDAMVTAVGTPQRVTPFNRATRSDGVLDNQTAVFEYPHAIATVRSSIVEPDGDERRNFEISGENGTIAIRPLEPPELRLTLERQAGGYNAGRHVVELPAAKGRYYEQLRDFAAIVRGDRRSPWSTEHDLAVHLAVLQASGLPTDQ